MKKHIFSATMLALCLTACSGEHQAEKAPKEPTQATQPSTPNTPKGTDTQTNLKDSEEGFVHYTVGSDVSYEPFSFKNEYGNPTGFEVDLLNAIGKVEKFKVTFVNTSRNEVTETLNSGKFDIWASSLSITEERKQQMDFSHPYIDFTRQIYVVDKPENANLKTPADFKGKKIAVNYSSQSAIDTATELTGSPDNVVKSSNFFASLKDTYTGQADGTLGDSRILQYAQTKHGSMKTRVINIGDTKKDIGFAVKKGNKEVLDKLNRGLKTVKADGTYNQLVEKWFGKPTN